MGAKITQKLKKELAPPKEISFKSEKSKRGVKEFCYFMPLCF
jgi:hypothetical protein